MWERSTEWKKCTCEEEDMMAYENHPLSGTAGMLYFETFDAAVT